MTKGASPASAGYPAGRRHPQTRPMLVCIAAFAFLGCVSNSIARHGMAKDPVGLDEQIAPARVGDWTFVGTEPGWLESHYEIGSRLFRYERADGAAMLVTAAVGQERYGAFSDVQGIHAQNGHERVGKRRAIVTNSLGGEATPISVHIYAASPDEGPFAFAALFWDGARMSGNLMAVKLSVTLRRAVGYPKAHVASYVARPIRDEESTEEVVQEVGDFMAGFLPALERMRESYVESPVNAQPRDS